MKKTVSILLTITMILVMLVPFTASVAALDETDAACVILDTDGTSVVKYYDSVATASGEVASNQTIKLLKNIEYTGDGESFDTYQGGKLPSGITFDMNGKTVSSPDDGGFCMYFKSCKNLKVINGTFDGSTKSNAVRVHHATGGASVTFENCRFIASNGNLLITMGDNGIEITLKDCYMECTRHGLSPQCKNTTLNLVNTVIVRPTCNQANSHMFNLYYVSGNTNTVNIYSGLFLDAGTTNPLFNLAGDATVNIYGGSLITKGGAAVFSNTNGTVNVYGGQLGGFGKTGFVLNSGSKEINVVNTTFLSDTAGTLGTGDKVYSHGNFNWYAKATGVPVLRDGAAVRLASDHNGIRFQTDISAEAIAAANARKDQGTEVSYGTLLVMADTVPAGMRVYTHAALDNAQADYRDLKATEEGITTHDDGSITLNACLVDVQSANLARNISAVSYICYTVNGQTVYVYSLHSANANSRSMSGVAEAALADTGAGYTPEQQAILRNYVVS